MCFLVEKNYDKKNIMLKKISDFFKIEFHSDRIYGFDIIRTLAISTVIYGHGSLLTPVTPGSTYALSTEFLDGVFVFFILSGFLIGQLLIYTLDNKPTTKATLVDFWKKRFLRTLPAYYFTLLVLIIISLLTIDGFGSIKTLFYFIFIQNFATYHPFFFAEAWTLSIEVWFYILIPLTAFLLKGYFKLSTKKSLLYTALFYVILGIIIRSIRYYSLAEIDGTVIDFAFRKQVITRIDSVTFGVFGAWIFHYYNTIWKSYKNIALVLGIAIFLYTKFPIFEHGYYYRTVLFYSLQSLSFLLILPFFSYIKTGKGVVFKIITTLSYVSFSIYLINLNLVQLFIINNINFGSLSGNYLIIVKYFLYLLLTIVGGIYMYKKIELPFMNMRKKLK
jgi:peptidoglycan/LPS O-acetylase OafA/YrhL